MTVLGRGITGLFAVILLSVVLTACGGSGEDRPGSVSVDPSSETVSVSGIGPGSSTGTGSQTNGAVPSVGLGGYEPVSDVGAHARVSEDVEEINGLLGTMPYDYDAIKDIYVQGKYSVNADGSVRTLAGFARNAGRSEPIWDDYTAYFNDKTWLDTFVMAAIDGTGLFAGEPDAVRKQGIQKGIQNQVMVAWMLHEMVGALEKAEAGNFDPASGAPHNWDEAWAFYHGTEPGHAPYATADKRGANLGTGTAVNDAILAAMLQGRDALVGSDAAGARQAYEEVLRQVQITYIQAAIRYAHEMTVALEAGDTAKARVEQAEGLAFYRVIEPLIAGADAGVASEVGAYLNLANPPADAEPAVREALESVYQQLGITADQVGNLTGS
ncbi:MAG: FEA1-related lipoprotein [Chloroflexi bacterium]|nr:FEA1-related lipoprotein [Chloroflexota bacterium]MDA1271851.1 FEA1-related lipoprotein [Chloroflexota bacterium]